jgi:hypothetical protein
MLSSPQSATRLDSQQQADIYMRLDENKPRLLTVSNLECKTQRELLALHMHNLVLHFCGKDLVDRLGTRQLNG